MADAAERSADADTPVNPYSLLEAVNNSSDTSHTGWLIFLAIMTYLMIAVAGVTHEALLTETPVQLPILQVNIQLKQFFQFAPVVLVLFHIGILAQLVLLARKALEFDRAISFLEISGKRTHPLRLELHNFFFVQSIAGSHRSALMSGFLNIMSWLTIIILPLVLLLYMQVAFLPYHDVATTWITRIFLTLDIVVVLLIGVFLMRAETSFFQAFWRSTITHPFSVVATAVVLGTVLYLSYFAATVPGERLDTIGRKLTAWAALPGDGKLQHSGLTIPALVGDDAILGMFHRNLVVTDSELLGGEGGKTLRLRGRDLRHAKLDRTDLAGVDLTGARLDGASLIGANLENASLGCAEPDALMLSDSREVARCVSARGVDLSRARLKGARLWGIDLSAAKLNDAELEGADLGNAVLSGASLVNAQLDKAELTGGVQAQGANFLNASLQGADLTGARLQLADFSSASMQGVILNFAQLEGAVLRDANLEAASLMRAKLIGADMADMRVTGGDLRGTQVWMSSTPLWDGTGLTDLSELVVRAPSDADLAALKAGLQAISGSDAGVRAKELWAQISGGSVRWSGTVDHQRWQSWVGATPVPPALTYREDLTTYLLKLMCSTRWSDGAVASGIARRAASPQFRGDAVLVYDRLRGNSCPASAHAAPGAMKVLSVAAENARN
ncbi:hypothetical protein APY04_1487 [Hyphomicrobium sulfonivorans]|uniref:Pentapeptide repeat family protein n=1 Tax=Hyphomicrobium sulfonivorans TaxID=121290 RepID=A0A120CWH6_HYPSL|nr:pentapeptide repeat-containing protein [Hyphomicrobium sulfonivorans]KWT69404.1 hypothetical protein APY04_1487 [Hyphomicrobium sulfonivorans]